MKCRCMASTFLHNSENHMSQDYALPIGSDRLNVAIKTKIANSLDALRTLHSGTSAPSSIVANMLWLDTSTTPPVLKLRDTSDATWISLVSIGQSLTTQMHAVGHAGSLSATTTALVGSAPRAGTISRVVMMASNASTSSAGNEWQVQVTKYRNSSPGAGLTLISAACGTETALGGVGGGSDFVADKVLVFTPNQNASVADTDVIELTLTKVGSATTLTDFRAFVELI